MFVSHASAKKRHMMDGIDMTPLAWGQKTILVQFDLRKGSVLPTHDHPHEQTGYLVSGRLRLTIAGETTYATAGDSWSIPGGTAHGAEALEDCVAVEVFSPLREEYLP